MCSGLEGNSGRRSRCVTSPSNSVARAGTELAKRPCGQPWASCSRSEAISTEHARRSNRPLAIREAIGEAGAKAEGEIALAELALEENRLSDAERTARNGLHE